APRLQKNSATPVDSGRRFPDMYAGGPAVADPAADGDRVTLRPAGAGDVSAPAAPFSRDGSRLMTTSSEPRNPVELLAEEFLERKRRGEQPTLREYLERHPELADEIRDLF